MTYCTNISDIPWTDFSGIVLIIPILSNSNLHRNDTHISSIYVSYKKEEYIIGFTHNDLSANNIEDFVIPNNIKLISYDSKVLKNIGIKCIDMELSCWLNTNNKLEIEPNEKISTYNRLMKREENINDYIPIVNHIDQCREIVYQFKLNFGKISSQPLNFYNDVVMENFRKMELVNLELDIDLVNKYYPNIDTIPNHSNYNIFTSTGRPSNTISGLNLAALPKRSGNRKILTVNNADELLIEFDYKGYHVALASKLINYDLPLDNLHEYFGRKYFNTPVLTPEQYSESKHITFQMLYGKNYQYKDIIFFQKIQEYRKLLWEEINSKGYIELPISKRKIKLENHPNFSENKLFNYVMQGHETEMNALILQDVLEYLYTRKSKMLLYTYDSILFKYYKVDGPEFISDIKSILTEYNFAVDFKVGKTYHDMIRPKSRK